MRQTLFRIPIDGPWTFGPLAVPGFGFGIVLLAWCVFGAVWLYRNPAQRARLQDLLTPAVTWLVVAAVIVFAPHIAHLSADRTIAEADGVLQGNPTSMEALITRSQAYSSKRDYAKAVEDLKTAVHAHPQSAIALNRLAWLEATCPEASLRDGSAALEHAKQACALTSSRNPEYLATLAAAQAELGEFPQAVETQRQALRLISSETRSEDVALLSQVPRMREQLQAAEGNHAFRDRSAGSSLPVFGFGAMLFLGFTAGAWTAVRRGARVGYAPETIWDIGIWLFIAGVIGCRVFYCIQYSHRIFYIYENGQYVLKSLPQMLLAAVNLPDGGLVYYGGIPAGLLAAVWMCRRRNISLLELGDVVVPSLFLGMAFGRIGCFLNGCCYGDRCELPWGVQFPMGGVTDMALVMRGFLGADQDFGVRLHPTQLYSSLDGFVLFFLTHTYFSYRPRNGSVIALGALTYPITRFAIESLRGDELGQFHTTLTISQWISILMFAIGVVFTIWLSRQPRLPSATSPTPVVTGRKPVPA